MAKYKRSNAGDCVVSIALREGFRPDDVWQLTDNEHLRPDGDQDVPEVIANGEKVYLPEKVGHKEPGAADQRHKFRKPDVPIKLRVKLLDFAKPRANKHYLFEVEGEQREGKTDGEGILEEVIPFDATEASVRLTGDDEGEHFIFKLGALEPARKIAGAQARLHNLGYNTGPIDNLMGPITERALKIFQKDQDIEITGEIDQQTVKKLIEVYAC